MPTYGGVLLPSTARILLTTEPNAGSFRLGELMSYPWYRVFSSLACIVVAVALYAVVNRTPCQNPRISGFAMTHEEGSICTIFMMSA